MFTYPSSAFPKFTKCEFFDIKITKGETKMETMYFILGMLSIVAAAFVAVIVWGIVKITQMLKTIKSHEEWQSHQDRETNQRLSDLHRDLDRRLDNMDRHAMETISALQRELDSRVNDIYSYTDSRLDKLADKALKQEKQIIKG